MKIRLLIIGLLLISVAIPVIVVEATVGSVIAVSPDYNIQTVFKVTSPEDCHGGYKDGSKGHFEWFDGECLLVDFEPDRFHKVPYKEIFAAPLKQIKAGVALIDVQCNEGKHIVYKHDRMRAACLTDETEGELLTRGWAALRLGMPATDDLGRDLCGWFEGKWDSLPRNCYGLKYPLLCSMSGGDLTDRACFIPSRNGVAPFIPTEINFQDSVNANNQFAFDYYTQVNENQNIFFSPWSITSAFAIVNEGAKGNTAAEIQNVFGLTENSKEQFKEINKILNQENPGYTIEVANSLWLAQDFTLNPDYVDTVQTYYDGTIEKVDFADDGTEVINDWVSDKTRQKIPKLFDPRLDPKTRLVIANAIYFNGTWDMPFDEKNTRDDKFIISPGEDIKVPFMNKDSVYNYTATDGFQIIELPYGENAASMLILLPDRIDGISSVESQLTSENLAKWRSEMAQSRLFLQIPKFTLETEYSLGKDLIELGIVEAFVGPADFSGLSSEPLLIDRAVHKAFVDVNEKGTEAAAATGIAMVESMPPTFRADHPFVFIILDNETGNVLFLGKVVNPS